MKTRLTDSAMPYTMYINCDDRELGGSFHYPKSKQSALRIAAIEIAAHTDTSRLIGMLYPGSDADTMRTKPSHSLVRGPRGGLRWTPDLYQSNHPMKLKLSDAAVRAAENAQPNMPPDYDAYVEAVDAQREYLLTLPFGEICDIAQAQGLVHYSGPLLEKLAVRTLRDEFSPY